MDFPGLALCLDNRCGGLYNALPNLRRPRVIYRYVDFHCQELQTTGILNKIL